MKGIQKEGIRPAIKVKRKGNKPNRKAGMARDKETPEGEDANFPTRYFSE
jgi:hypothetical protein